MAKRDRRLCRIPSNKPSLVGRELEYVTQVITAGHFSGDGSFTERCHQWLEKYLGCTKAFLTHSCTGALEMAAMLCEVKPGDEIIMPSLTFVSTANAFVLRGGVPVFLDIKPETLNIDERLIEEAITSRTKAIVAVHYAGITCEMDKILEIAGRYNLLVVEDAALSFLSTYKNKFAGTIGHFGCLSFHETKSIISGEGGALLVNDEQFIARCEMIREKGTNRNQFLRGEVDKYMWTDIGSSYLPSELVAAFLFAQFEQADKIIERKRLVFRKYFESLSPLAEKGLIKLPTIEFKDSYNGELFYIITKSLEERKRLIQYLKEKNISAVIHYVPLHSSPAGKIYGRTSGGMQVTNDVSSRLVRLPLYYGITDDDIQKVVTKLKEFYLGMK